MKTNKGLAVVIALSVVVGGVFTTSMTFASGFGLEGNAHGPVIQVYRGWWYFRDGTVCQVSLGKLVNCHSRYGTI
jgi:hypothetical protein